MKNKSTALDSFLIYKAPKGILGYKNFWRVTNFIKKMPLKIRVWYWTMLYYYNKQKHPLGEFTLGLYISYAHEKPKTK